MDLPRQRVKTDLGILKYSTVRARANEFGGIMHSSATTSTKLFESKFLGSTTEEKVLVKILNSLEQRTSYP